MSYLDTTAGRPDPRTIIAVAVIHGAAGLALVAGLTVSGVIEQQPPPLTGESIIVPLPPPPPPPVDQQKPEVEPPAPSEIYVPTPPLPLPPIDRPRIDGTEVIRDAGPITVTPSASATGTGTGIILPLDPPRPPPTATIAPSKPVPRGDPGGWITTADYRARWINEGMTGTARFRLSIGTNGRVGDCRLTRTTGHGALDAATCDLIQRRARFTPSRDSAGVAVHGSYEGSIVWRLPD